jgi:hypothetical protein
VSIRVVSTYSLYEALKAEGFELPEECRDVRLLMNFDSAFMVQFDCFLSGERLHQFGRALARLGYQPKEAS